jgi:glutaminase
LSLNINIIISVINVYFLSSFNNSVFLSEKDTADRNFALAYYMKENKCFPKGFVLQDCLDFYFQVITIPGTGGGGRRGRPEG